MVGRRGVALVLVVAGALASACLDLFHSTDFETKCDLDPSGPGCPMEASSPADVRSAEPTDFCAWSSATARAYAEHACAWLGACSAPFDRNAFGTCMIDAILAYDCKTNPNRPVRGKLHEVWDALWQAQSCDTVTQALVPRGEHCASVGYGCGTGDAAAGVLFECLASHGVASPESCLVQGRSCEKSACVPPGASTTCRASHCAGSVLHDCEDGEDMGYDCQYFGSGECAGEVDAAACSPADAGAHCTKTTRVACASGIATGCATGRAESVDCKVLTGDGGTCHSGTPSPTTDLAGACQGNGDCTPGCDGDLLVGCGQGAKYTTSCSGQKLGRCTSVDVVGIAGDTKGYACAAP
jgi:hypothetical protein